MTDSGKPARKSCVAPDIGALNALDLALESQRLEFEYRQSVQHFLPLLDQIEKICRGLDDKPPADIVSRAEAIAMLAVVADNVAASMGLNRTGTVGERVDAHRHEVVHTVPASSESHGVVMEIVEYGWELGGSTLRPTRVVAGRKG